MIASDPPPCRMATNAEGRSLAAPQARPECMPTAAYRSACVAPMMAAAAPPADRPRDVDALRIDRIVPHDLAGDAGDQRRFARRPAAGRPCETSSSTSPGWLRLGCSG